MQYVLWIIASLLAYVGGLIILLRITPRLCFRSFDEGLFMGLAALAIAGALLAFGSFVVTYSIFSGTLAVRIVNFLMLIGILVAGIRLSMRSLRPHVLTGTIEASRIMVGSYGILLAFATFYCMVQLLR